MKFGVNNKDDNISCRACTQESKHFKTSQTIKEDTTILVPHGSMFEQSIHNALRN